MNLVGPGPLGLHLDESDIIARKLQVSGEWADLGSGAGFPGVSLAAHHPGATVTLVESRQKRAAFLHVLLRQVRLPNLRLFHGRAEQLAHHGLDGVISRAFAPPDRYLPLAASLLRPTGTAILLASGSENPAAEGLTLEERILYKVHGRTRHILRYHFNGKN